MVVTDDRIFPYHDSHNDDDSFPDMDDDCFLVIYLGDIRAELRQQPDGKIMIITETPDGITEILLD